MTIRKAIDWLCSPEKVLSDVPKYFAFAWLMIELFLLAMYHYGDITADQTGTMMYIATCYAIAGGILSLVALFMLGLIIYSFFTPVKQ